jgi:hypothetical protein
MQILSDRSGISSIKSYLEMAQILIQVIKGTPCLFSLDDVAIRHFMPKNVKLVLHPCD